MKAIYLVINILLAASFAIFLNSTFAANTEVGGTIVDNGGSLKITPTPETRQHDESISSSHFPYSAQHNNLQRPATPSMPVPSYSISPMVQPVQPLDPNNPAQKAIIPHIVPQNQTIPNATMPPKGLQGSPVGTPPNNTPTLTPPPNNTMSPASNNQSSTTLPD